MKQTAVEWLVEQIQSGKIEVIYSDKIHSIKCIPEIVEQAKAMEKEQIVDAYANGSNDRLKNTITDFFNETYGSNHIVDTNEMIDHIGDANKMVEISDEEVFNQSILAMEEWYGSGCDSEIDAYFRGAKWMQKQLKGGNS